VHYGVLCPMASAARWASLTRLPPGPVSPSTCPRNDAEAIISGDKDLLDWELQRPPVVSPAQLEQSGVDT
jgi:hypothetical protein